MGFCRECKYYNQTLPGLWQCMNKDSFKYKQDVGPTSSCNKKPLSKGEVKNEEWEILRNRIKKSVEDRGITLKDLSENTNVTYQAIWQTVSGRTTPRLLTIMEIAKALNVSIDWLCGMTD